MDFIVLSFENNNSDYKINIGWITREVINSIKYRINKNLYLWRVTSFATSTIITLNSNLRLHTVFSAYLNMSRVFERVIVTVDVAVDVADSLINIIGFWAGQHNCLIHLLYNSFINSTHIEIGRGYGVEFLGAIDIVNDQIVLDNL